MDIVDTERVVKTERAADSQALENKATKYINEGKERVRTNPMTEEERKKIQDQMAENINNTLKRGTHLIAYDEPINPRWYLRICCINIRISYRTYRDLLIYKRFINLIGGLEFYSDGWRAT